MQMADDQNVQAQQDAKSTSSQETITKRDTAYNENAMDVINKETYKEHTKCQLWIYQFVQINAIIQLILDIVLEIMHIVPSRVNHLALTIINAFLAVKTLSAIKQNKFRFLHEDIQILTLLEICLIFGDIFVFIDSECFENYANFTLQTFLYARLTFIACSLYNLIVALYIMKKFNLYHWYYVGDSRDLRIRKRDKNKIVKNDNNNSSVAANKNKDEYRPVVSNHVSMDTGATIVNDKNASNNNNNNDKNNNSFEVETKIDATNSARIDSQS